MKQIFYSGNTADTQKIAAQIAPFLKAGHILQLQGEMGAGKTTFTSALLAALGSEDTISSPTFSLVNAYDTPKFSVYHFDLYRLESEEDIEHIGFFDYLGQNALLIIEWSALVAPYLPKDKLFTLTIETDATDAQKRTFTLVPPAQ